MKLNKVAIYLIVIIAFIAVIVLFNSFYIVSETEQVVITQFGKPIGESYNKAGLYIKVPFIQDVNRFEKRLLEWDGSATEILAKDKKFILVDSYARWRIVDPLQLFISVVDEQGAQTRLDNIIEAATRNVITSNVLIEVVRSSNRIMTQTEIDTIRQTEVEVDSIQVGREQVAADILEASKDKVREYGIELVSVRVKRINYIQEVRQKVFERMIAERLRIAEKYRSEGMGRKAEIEGEMEKELQLITSEAYRRAQILKGEADKEAIKIYAKAYERDPEFYSFLKSLESYRETLDEKSWLILSTDSDYLKYLKDINAR
ncbi:MAG: protease modulator HflC [bacterium]|nr:protease modulator HflC [bacterium]